MFVTEEQIAAALSADCNDWSVISYLITTDNATAEEVIRAALTAALTSIWRPIEEAPRDGTPVDLWSPEHGGRLTNYRFRKITKDNTFFEPVNGGYTCVREPTHFMPLPAPPAAVGGG